MYPITDFLWSFFKIKCTVSFIPSESANSLYKNVAQRGNVLVQILLMLLLHLSFSRNFIVSIAFITESQSKYIISDISPYNIFFWIIFKDKLKDKFQTKISKASLKYRLKNSKLICVRAFPKIKNALIA